MTGSDAKNDRSARHLALPQIGAAGQARIESATALLIGVGGIGCAAASYLVSSGIGQLLLCDFDTVDESNLGRQTLYGPADVGQLKVSCAATRLSSMNPDIQLTEIPDRLSDHALSEAVRLADIVLDGSDNFSTRFQVNDACVSHGRVLVSGSAIRFEGQLAIFGPDYDISPCYRCLYKEADESLDNCAGNGVFSPVPGVIGTLMAAAALKSLIGIDDDQRILTLYDGMAGEWRRIRLTKRDDCAVCAY
ncbi:MAG: molybdopterin/thiamine biosynthesis adenylyltransferase [Woeseiaceae bacterium]|jgi:molybdopterin/thiamine biosynthesis adenylyltransferase